MKEMKMHIQYVRLREFKNKKNVTETVKNLSSNVSSLITKSETGWLAACSGFMEYQPL